MVISRFVLPYLFIIQCAGAEPRLLNKLVKRTVYTINQLIHINYEITMENHGNTTVTRFNFAVEGIVADNVVYVEIFQVDLLSETKLRPSETSIEDKRGKFWFVDLKYPILDQSSVHIKAVVVLAHCLRPLPAYIYQEDKQLVFLQTGLYFYSPYYTDEQTTVIELPSSNVENYSVIEPTKKYRNSIIYGPYRGVSPWNTSKIAVHFEYNKPLLTVKSLVRVMEISPWGNVAIVEKIKLQNTGAFLKGPFSRYVYQTRYNLPDATSADHITALLPNSVKELYYYDDIGNISTSYLLHHGDSKKVKLKFRFPLFGGWNVSFMIGYSVPASDYLFHIEEDYVLRMKLLNIMYEGMLVENMETFIILPEGSVSGELLAPLYVKREDDTKQYLLLDTIGRTVVKFQAKNITEKHIQYFQLYFRLSKLSMFYKPLLLIVFVFILLFILCCLKHREVLLKLICLNPVFTEMTDNIVNRANCTL